MGCGCGSRVPSFPCCSTIEICRLELTTTEFVKGTSFETIESLTQPNQLYQDLAICAEVHRNRDTNEVQQAKAVFDLLAFTTLVPTRTQSVLTLQGEGMTDLSHKAKVQKRKGDDNGSIKIPVTESQSTKITEDASEKILKAMSELFSPMNEVKGTVDGFRGEMKGDVKNLEDKLTEGFRIEGIQKKERR